MRIVILCEGKKLLDYHNNSKNHNRIPNSFEKLTTQLGCPKCNKNTLVECLGYCPSIDNICISSNCHHSIEVKSILAEGSQSDGFVKEKGFGLKLGSVNTYEKVNKNKTLLLFWYNIKIQTEDFVILDIKDIVMIPMTKLYVGKNCKRLIVKQKKKTK